jgi:hypothetical protein
VTSRWQQPLGELSAVLDAARAVFPLGDEGDAVVLPSPWPTGRTGLPLRVRGLPGFVDALWLPVEPDGWPRAGDVLRVVAVQHRGEQVRVVPVDPRFRAPRRPDDGAQEARWTQTRSRYLVGSEVVVAPIAATS